MVMHKLLPENQHGFQQKRSTMTALSSMLLEWTKNSEENLIKGILVWDLSAAYDTLCPSLFCEKLKNYGFDNNTYKWFMSFLTGRSQRVKIGTSLSESVKLTSGVPQGGILSSIIFIIYGADMDEWVKHLCIFNYADDTESSCKVEDEQVVMKKLEEDATNIKHSTIHGIKWTGCKPYQNRLHDA
jgi:hypothetical protein